MEKDKAMNEDLDLLVEQALFNAKDNGYDFNGWTDVEIANDLIDYDGSVNDYLTFLIVQSVKRMRRS